MLCAKLLFHVRASSCVTAQQLCICAQLLCICCASVHNCCAGVIVTQTRTEQADTSVQIFPVSPMNTKCNRHHATSKVHCHNIRLRLSCFNVFCSWPGVHETTSTNSSSTSDLFNVPQPACDISTTTTSTSPSNQLDLHGPTNVQTSLLESQVVRVLLEFGVLRSCAFFDVR